MHLEQRSKSTVDTAGGRIWELDASQFELRNPAWQYTLSGALSKVAAGLGIAPGAARVKAELCKLSMSSEGAFLDQCEVYVPGMGYECRC